MKPPPRALSPVVSRPDNISDEERDCFFSALRAMPFVVWTPDWKAVDDADEALAPHGLEVDRCALTRVAAQ